MKTFKKYDYFFKMMAFYAIVSIILYSCVECKKDDTAKVPEPVIPLINKMPVSEGFANASNVYVHTSGRIVLVKERGMEYMIDYYHESSIVNLTKDSLEVVALKTQVLKDSLQIEVFKKYLKK